MAGLSIDSPNSILPPPPILPLQLIDNYYFSFSHFFKPLSCLQSCFLKRSLSSLQTLLPALCSLPSHPSPLPGAWIHPTLPLDNANFLFSVWLLNLTLCHKQATCETSGYPSCIAQTALNTTPPQFTDF